MSSPDVADLIESCVSPTNGRAWAELVERFGPDIRRSVARVLRSSRRRSDGLLEDLVQETYCRLLERAAFRLRRCRRRDEAGVRAYLCKVARNVAIDGLRSRSASKRGSRALIEGTDSSLIDRAPDLAPSVEERLVLRQQRRLFLEMCRRVAGRRAVERNYQILKLAFLGGLTSREIVAELQSGLTTNSVDSSMP